MAGGASTFSFPIGPRRARGRQEIGFEPVSLATSLKGKLVPASPQTQRSPSDRNHWQDRNAALHAKRLLEERLVEYRKRLIFIVAPQEGRATLNTKVLANPQWSISTIL